MTNPNNNPNNNAAALDTVNHILTIKRGGALETVLAALGEQYAVEGGNFPPRNMREAEVLAEYVRTRIFEMIDSVLSGRWGVTCKEDSATNDAAVNNGDRIIAAYPIDPTKPCAGWGDNTIWVIVDAAPDAAKPSERDTLTLLLPSDY